MILNNGVLDGVRQIGAAVRDLAVKGGVPGAPLGFRLRGANVAGPPQAGTWKAGDETRDRNGAIWVCTAGGTPGVWINPASGALNIVFDGDSLTAGSGALPYGNFPNGNDYPSQVAGSLNHAGTFYNVGVGGEQTSAMITNGPSVVDAKLVTGANNIVCFHGGTNDIFYTDSATTSYGRIVTYCQARQAAGWKVIVGTLTPRSDASTPADFDTVRLSVNSSIRANWPAFANGLADIGADANMGTSGQETNTQYYNGDNVHHNPTGYRVLAGYYLAALARLGVTGHQHGDKSGLTSDLWIPAASFALTSGTPTLTSVDNSVAWQLNHSSTDVICTYIKIPQDWLSFVTQIFWTQSAGGSGNVAWRADLQPVLSGSNLTLGNVAGAQTNTAVPAGNFVAVTTLRGSDNNQNGSSPSRGMFNLRAVRLGTSGGDTYTSGALLLGAYLYRGT